MISNLSTLSGWPGEELDRKGIEACAHLAEVAVAAGGAPQVFEVMAKRAGYELAGVTPAPCQIAWAASPEAIVFAPAPSSGLAAWKRNPLDLLDWVRDACSVIPCRWPELGLEKELRAGWGWRRHFTRVLALEMRLKAVRLGSSYPSASVYISGFSLGGAIALPLTRTLARGGVEVAATVTHNAPRVFNRAGAEAYSEAHPRTWAAVIERDGRIDAVSQLPAQRWGRWAGVTIAQRLFEAGEKLREAERQAEWCHVVPSRRLLLTNDAELGPAEQGAWPRSGPPLILQGVDHWDAIERARPLTFWATLRRLLTPSKTARAHFGATVVRAWQARRYQL